MLINGPLDECRKRSWVRRKKEIQENKNLLVKCEAEVQMPKYG